VIIEAGEMLAVAEPFLEQNMHPTVLVQAYRMALQDALQALAGIAIPVDTNDRETMLDVVRSTIGFFCFLSFNFPSHS
jgi:T-complex protein 1 subunit gamma